MKPGESALSCNASRAASLILLVAVGDTWESPVTIVVERLKAVLAWSTSPDQVSLDSSRHAFQSLPVQSLTCISRL